MSGQEVADGGLVEERSRRGEDAFADGAADRLRNSEADPHPGIESGVTDPDGVPAQPLSLPVAGQVILEFRGHDVRQHGFRRQFALKQPLRSRQLGGRLVPATGAARLSGQSSACRNDRTTENRTMPRRSIWRARQYTVPFQPAYRRSRCRGENVIERSREYARERVFRSQMMGWASIAFSFLVLQFQQHQCRVDGHLPQSP